MKKQVDREHYDFDRYVTVPRWNSFWHQLNVIISLRPNNILEIGPGLGLLKAVGQSIGLNVETVDLDSDLDPDYIASATDLPLESDSFDLVCAFQVLEHLPFDSAISALDELARVARKHVVISLPDSRRTFRYLAHIPSLGERRMILPRPQLNSPVHNFDGEHYWEINKQGYELKKVLSAMLKSRHLKLIRTFRPFENPYHRFFIFALPKNGC